MFFEHIFNRIGSINVNNPGTCFKFLNNSLSELPAFMLVDITSFAKDLELPGLPTTNNGMRSSVQIAIINTFSLRAIFLAIF